MRRKIKFGIFGLGRGSHFYKSILLNDGNIVAICDRDDKKTEKAREELGKDVSAIRIVSLKKL